MVKVILGYQIEPGLTAQEYDRWLYDIHVPDLLANPHLRKIVFNTVIRMLRGDQDYYRIAELHYDDQASYERARAWSEANPVPPERGAQGRTHFLFTCLCDAVEIEAAVSQPAGS